ncbi:Ricin B lectin [Nosema bombycis CQ1]|uniref:Ricin B lectin n=1 Tax=Nosema bombycis (strain CQ1 / CVCC 102059) TaxID=578461 RepID=R0KNB2_NOSB1|nr:Ricin B lectin [Nosema bombycis CQ1]WGJ64407.1 ricin B lectin-like protein [Nosema bombycis]|eukprot:EOB11642.1 Ricin B lectin [Nosema bombycis CQ1]
MKSEDKYLTTFNESGKDFLKLTSNVSEAADVNISSFKDGLVFVKDTKDNDKVFDISDNNVELIFYKYHGGKNQQFSINLVGSSIYNLMNKGKCLEYDPLSTKILLNSCTNSENQIFEIVEPEKKNEIPNPKNYEYNRYKLLNRDADPLFEFSEKSGLKASLAERFYPDKGGSYSKTRYSSTQGNYPQQSREKNDSWSYSRIRHYPESSSFTKKQSQSTSRLPQEPLFFEKHHHHHHHSTSRKNDGYSNY